MGATRFQMRRLARVRTELAHHVLAYNIKRMVDQQIGDLLVLVAQLPSVTKAIPAFRAAVIDSGRPGVPLMRMSPSHQTGRTTLQAAELRSN